MIYNYVQIKNAGGIQAKNKIDFYGFPQQLLKLNYIFNKILSPYLSI